MNSLANETPSPAAPAAAFAEPPDPALKPLPKWRALQWVCFGVLLFLFCFSRLWDLGHKALMHDESLFVYYTYYQMFREWSYNYMPILHGPLMLQIQAMLFHVLGDSTYTMRLGCALCGIAGFFSIWGMRRYFGDAGMWGALVFYTVSTGIAFYQRFFRNDALFMYLTLTITLCACHWFRTGSRRWLVALMAGVTCLFCNMENSVIFYFSGFTFFLFWMVQDTFQCFWSRRLAEPFESDPLLGRPRSLFPNVFWLNAAIWVFLILCLTRIFEGIKFDADVASATQSDWALKDVRSLKLLLGIVPPATPELAKAPEKLLTPGFWRKFYGCGFLASFIVLFMAKIVIQGDYGHKRALARFFRGIADNKWWFLAGLFLCLFLYIGAFTTWFRNPRGPFKIYKDTFGYWVGQHAWHRIRGPFHYHWTIALAYELPTILLVFGGWFFAMGRARWGRLFALPVIALVTAASIRYFNSPAWDQWLAAPILNSNGKQVFQTGAQLLDKALKLDSGFHLYMIFFLTFTCLVLTWSALWKGEIFHAWLIWWTVTSIGGYSYAGEKVPWLGGHIDIPLVLLAGSYAGKLYHHPFIRRHLVAFGIFMGIIALWNGKSMVNACIYNSDDPRERMVYGHTSQDLAVHARCIVNYWERASIRLDWQRNHNDLTKLKDIKVLVKATDAAIWPLRWYLRDIEWTEYDDPAKANDKYQFVFLDANDLDKYPNIKERYVIYRGRGRCFWQPRLPDWKRLIDVWLNIMPKQYLDAPNPFAGRAFDAKQEWKKLKDYMLLRKTWEYPNAQYPSVSSVDYFFCVRKDIDL